MGCLLLTLSSCARMGNPDGGWYDETPPHVIGATPADQATDVKSKKIRINFDEYIKIDNVSENVIVSPPQNETPEIQAEGKAISVKLVDSLKANTTYTVDFSSAITDNNEGNPLGNYTYTFSTGDHIDTLEVAGYVVQADNLEPVKGILVGLYDNLADSAFCKLPMLRVARTDSRGHFVVKGVAPGRYHVFALQDADGDYRFGQKSEMLAFDDKVYIPSFKPDVRQDTIWRDSLHIANIQRVNYTHFLPDDVCLRAFNEIVTTRYLLKSERKEANRFSLFYSYGDSLLPKINGLNFNADGAFLVDANEKRDTVTYWLRDSALINQDTLRLSVEHRITDSLGVLRLQTDTLELLSKQPYAKRMKEQEKKVEQWRKQQEKKAKKGAPVDSVMPVEALKLDIKPSGNMNPDDNVTITAQEPLMDVDTAHVHLFSHAEQDSLWYREPFELTRTGVSQYLLKASWRPGLEYSLETDSAAFCNLYGVMSGPLKTGLKVGGTDQYATLLVTLQGMNGKPVVGQLLDQSGKILKTAVTENAQLEFYYLNEGDYYLSIFIDTNRNGKWDTGDYEKKLQPEQVYYYPEPITCKAKWDVTETWNPVTRPLYQQKPADLVKTKGDKKKTIQHRNAQRAAKLGIQYVPKM
ncbi:MAG: Ig-like domain-containing protein [Prevotella sp.]